MAHFPFKNNMSFVVIMPTYFEWNVSQVLANLSWDILHQPLQRERPTKVLLPKLHLKYHLDLVATLSQLGEEAGHGATTWVRLGGEEAPSWQGVRDKASLVSLPFLKLKKVRGFDGRPWAPVLGCAGGLGNEDLLCLRQHYREPARGGVRASLALLQVALC